MRVTTELWVSALVRRVFAEGGFAAIGRRGSPEAGAVMLVLRDRLGGARLFAPAPQASYDDARPEERQFTEIDQAGDEAALSRRIEREIRFDPDLWIVEIEVGPELFGKLVTLTTP